MARRSLIVDAAAADRIASKAALTAARYESITAASGCEALAILARERVDLILIAAELPDLTASGLLDRIGDGDPATPPCIVVSAEDDSDLRAGWIDAGVAMVLTAPVPRPWLLTCMRAVLRAHDGRLDLTRQVQTAARIGLFDATHAGTPAPRIDIVARHRAASGRAMRGLSAHLGHAVTARTPELCLAEAERGAPPDLILLADDGPRDEALWLVSEIRSHADLRRVALVVEYDPADAERGARALDLGAHALVSRTAGLAERAAILRRELRWKTLADRQRAQLAASLELAATDHLTGLRNRRYALHYLADLAARDRGGERGYGILVADIDHFKQVNDTYGHAVGDAILVEVAQRLQSNLRDHDLVARLGGEEFLVVISETGDAEALMAAERLREAISSRPIRIGGVDIPVSLSLGVARGIAGAADATIAMADAALYRAKRAGRDRSRLATAADRACAQESATRLAASPIDPITVQAAANH